MTEYLTVKKILQDCVALYRSHFLYMTTLIGGVLIPYTFIVKLKSLPDTLALILVPIFMLLTLTVEIVSISMVSTGYIDREFNIWNDIKRSIPRLLNYTLITATGVFAVFLGLNLFIIPGIVATLFFNLIKVDYCVNDGIKLFSSVKSVIESLKNGYIFKVLRIYTLPSALQFLIGFAITPFFHLETLEQDIFRLYTWFTLALILVFPVSVCFRVSVFYNLLKERTLNPPNQLV